MGNLCSRSHGIAKAEDSMHVMISHDKKAALKRGEAGVGGYVPRAEHPALAKAREKQEQEQQQQQRRPQPVVAVEEDDDLGLPLDDDPPQPQQ